MRIPKRYKDGTVTKCAYCDKPAIYKKNAVGVCKEHKDIAPDMKCVCGGELEARDGKYGTFYLCWKCNKPWSPAKAKAMNR